MLNEPMDILKAHPVRKTKDQKAAFRADVQAYAKTLGYECKLEEGKSSVQNIVIGDPKKARYLVTAHYDTLPVLGCPISSRRAICWPLFSGRFLWWVFYSFWLWVPVIWFGFLPK